MALGYDHGVAKEATLVNVKYFDSLEDHYNALCAVYSDIITKNRASKSVILITNAALHPSDPADILNPSSPNYSETADSHHQILDGFFQLGIPVVGPAGNDRQVPGRLNVDFWPMNFESDNFPLIVVGEATAKRFPSDVSQIGAHVTTLAFTEGAEVTDRDGFNIEDQGTSLSESTSYTLKIAEREI
jgi:hypothetical protein